MEEVPKPVNLVKSGKTYRQLFDAEVQLMKSLGKSTFNSLKILPQILVFYQLIIAKNTKNIEFFTKII